MSLLKYKYLKTVSINLLEKFEYINLQQVPKLLKIEINSGLGLKAQNKNYLQHNIKNFRAITGQHPVITIAKKSIAGFKIRAGMPLGLKVTLRREKMYAFLERLIKISLPRVRDFRGLSPKSFDNFGNYNLGISDPLIFPEVEFNDANLASGLDIAIETSAFNRNESFFLLQELGLPFGNL